MATYSSSSSVSDKVKILILGNSIVWRLEDFIRHNANNYISLDFKLGFTIDVAWKGIVGRTIQQALEHDMAFIRNFQPDIVVIALGTDDLADPYNTTQSISREMRQLVRRLHRSAGVQHIIVGQVLELAALPMYVPNFNERVYYLNRQLDISMRSLAYATFWFHQPLTHNDRALLQPNGACLNTHGNLMLYFSLRSAILQALQKIQC